MVEPLIPATVTAVGGGSLCDVLVGTLPPRALLNEPLLWSVIPTGLLVFRFHPRVQARERLIYHLDTLGLAPWGWPWRAPSQGWEEAGYGTSFPEEVPGILYRAGDL